MCARIPLYSGIYSSCRSVKRKIHKYYGHSPLMVYRSRTLWTNWNWTHQQHWLELEVDSNVSTGILHRTCTAIMTNQRMLHLLHERDVLITNLKLTKKEYSKLNLTDHNGEKAERFFFAITIFQMTQSTIITVIIFIRWLVMSTIRIAI